MMKAYKKYYILLSLLLNFLFINLAFTQSLRINEVMTANTTSLQDEFAKYPDWIELKNHSLDTLYLEGYGLSTDENDLFKWTLPPVSLAPFEYLIIYSSGRDRKWRNYFETVIDRGDDWRYTVVEPEGNWAHPDYDDSTWLVGSSGFGYGDGDDATVLDRVGAVFLRKKFWLDQPLSSNGAVLFLDYDDAYVAYLNGQEVGRRNLSREPHVCSN